jgi:hypothetical protein
LDIPISDHFLIFDLKKTHHLFDLIWQDRNSQQARREIEPR